MDGLAYDSESSWTSVIESAGMAEFWSDNISTDDSYTGSSSVCETPRSPSSCDDYEATETVQPDLVPFSLPLSEPVVPAPEPAFDFQFAAGCGLMETYEKPLKTPSRDVDLKQLKTRVFVRRREMSPSNPLFHSIRTRTASVISVCFFGDEEQVSAISQRSPRIYFNVESFLSSAESLKNNGRDLLLLVKMRDVNECAHFAFSHGALAVPPTLIYASPASSSSNAQPVYACVMEFVLAAIDTTIRNLGGQRMVNVDLDVLLSSDEAGLQASYAEFQAQVDVQLGLAGRTARPRRGETKNARARKAAAVAKSTAPAPKKTFQPARRVQKRALVDADYNLERKFQTTRPLDLDVLAPAASPSVSQHPLSTLPVGASLSSFEYEMLSFNTTPAATTFYPTRQSNFAATSAASYETMHPYCTSAAATTSCMNSTANAAYGHTANGLNGNGVTGNGLNFYSAAPSLQTSSFAGYHLPQFVDDAAWLYPTPQIAAYGANSASPMNSFYNTAPATSASCDPYRYGSSL